MTHRDECGPRSFDGRFYEPIGDFIRENYLRWGFTRGTLHEVDFLLDLLQLPQGASIVDIGCGTGRHSLELARRGFRTTGIDVSRGLIEVARRTALAEGLAAATFIEADATAMSFEEHFDAAICLCEGAFGLAGSDAANQAILSNVAASLKPGAPFVLTAINAYGAVRRAPPSYDLYTCTHRDLETIASPDGQQRQVEIFTSSFTYRELKLMLEEAGFSIEAGYGVEAGNFARRPLTVDSVEVMMVARRR